MQRRAFWLLATVLAAGLFPLPCRASVSSASSAWSQPISANFREVDFESALEFLAQSAGRTIVLSPKARAITKPVTVRLAHVPLLRALEYLVRGQGLVFRFDEETILISTLEEMEAEPLETRVMFLQQGPGLFATFEPLTEAREGIALQPAPIQHMTTIRDTLEGAIPKVNGSAMLLDERTGALSVTHVPYYMDRVAQLLHELDVLPPEVRIEARFIELTMSDTDEFGFDAQLTGDARLTGKTDANGTRGNGLQLSSVGSSLRRGTAIDFTNFANQTSGNGLNLTLQGVLSGVQYQAVLHALAENKKTKTLSAPQITTLNNQTATIKVVTEFVYASKYEPSVVREDLNGDGKFDAVVNGVRETRFVNVPQDFVTKDLGILLHVTPSVGKDHRTVTMALKPEVSEQKTEDTFSGEIKLPRFTTRNLSTTIVVEDGETVVLGGLMKDVTSQTTTQVPGLSRVPLIGGLFRKRADAVERSNLLIFITAHVVEPHGTLARSTQPTE